VRGPGVPCCAKRGPGASPCTCAVRSAGAGVPASFGVGTGAAAVRSAGVGVPASFSADTGAAAGSGGPSDAYTGAVATAASAFSLSCRAGSVPPTSHPSGFSTYPSHGDLADGVSGRDSLRHRGETRVSPVPSSVCDALADPH